MDYIRATIWKSREKRRIYHVVSKAVSTTRTKGEKKEKDNGSILFSAETLQECVAVAESENAEWLLSPLCDVLRPSSPVKAYKALKLLEYLVQWCNRNFHVALAQCTRFKERLLVLATTHVIEKVGDTTDKGRHDAEEESFLLHPARQAQHLARLTILEYSRIFVGDTMLEPLCRLASVFESQTKRNLLRAIHVQEHRVRFREIEPKDIIPLVPSAAEDGDDGFHSFPFGGMGHGLFAPRGPSSFGTPHTLTSSSDDWIPRTGMPYPTLESFFGHHADPQPNTSSDSSPSAPIKVVGPFSAPDPFSPLPWNGSARLHGLPNPSNPGHTILPETMTKPLRWACLACHRENSPMSMICALCETPRFQDEEEKEEGENKQDNGNTEGNNELLDPCEKEYKAPQDLSMN